MELASGRIIVAGLMLLASPAIASTCDTTQITPGMSYAQVIAICPNPTADYTMHAMRKIVYMSGTHVDIVFFREGRDEVRRAMNTAE